MNHINLFLILISLSIKFLSNSEIRKNIYSNFDLSCDEVLNLLKKSGKTKFNYYCLNSSNPIAQGGESKIFLLKELNLHKESLRILKLTILNLNSLKQIEILNHLGQLQPKKKKLFIKMKQYHILRKEKLVIQIFEYCPFGNLQNYSDQIIKPNVYEILIMFQHILLQVEVLHDLKIVHLDLKPENMVLCKNHFPKLIDFSFANKTQTKVNQLKGTWQFLDPLFDFQFRQNKQNIIVRKYDIFSLGSSLYLMLFNQSLFDQNQLLFKTSLLEIYKSKQYISLPECFPEELVQVLQASLTLNRFNRINIQEMGKKLNDLLIKIRENKEVRVLKNQQFIFFEQNEHFIKQRNDLQNQNTIEIQSDSKKLKRGYQAFLDKINFKEEEYCQIKGKLFKEHNSFQQLCQLIKIKI